MSAEVSNLERRDGRWRQREKAVFEYLSAEWTPVAEVAAALFERDGQRVRIVRLISEPADFTSYPTAKDRAAHGRWAGYRVVFDDGYEATVFEDELTEVLEP